MARKLRWPPAAVLPMPTPPPQGMARRLGWPPAAVLLALVAVAVVGALAATAAGVSATLLTGPLPPPLAPTACRTDDGGATRERDPVLCERARWDDGSARGGEADELYYVTATGFGALRIADFERGGGGVAQPRRRARTWASAVGAQPVTGTAACVVAPNDTLWTWLALAPSTYAVAGIDMTTLSVFYRGTPLDVAAATGGFGVAALGAATWDEATQTLYAASEPAPATPLPPNFTPLLLLHRVASDTSDYVTFDLAAVFGVDAVNMAGARIAALEALPASTTLAFALCSFPRQTLRVGGVPVAQVTPPLVVGLNNTDFGAGSLVFSNLLAGRPFSCGSHVRSGCANARLSLMTLPLLELAVGIGAVVAVPALHMTHYLFEGGAMLFQTRIVLSRYRLGAQRAPGACAWTHNGTALFTTASLADTAASAGASTLVDYEPLVNGTVLPTGLRVNFPPRAAPLAVETGTIADANDLETGTIADAAPVYASVNATSAAAFAARRLTGGSRLRLSTAAAAAPHAPPPNIAAPFFAWRGHNGTVAGQDQAAATPGHAARVIDGTLVTDATAVPFQCFVYTPSGGGCTCQVLDEWTVITAAHCLATGNVLIDTSLTIPYYVFTGSTTLFNGDGLGTTTTARRSATHPRASTAGGGGGREVDVGIVRLDTPLVFTARTRPLAYARSRSAGVRVGDLVRLVGWGRFVDGVTGTTLRSYAPRVVSENIFAEDPGATRMLALRDDGGRAACSGDSGAAVTVLDAHTGQERMVALFSIILFGAGGGCRNGTALAVDIVEAAAWLDRRERFTYETPYPRPPTPPSRQSGQLVVQVLDGGDGSDDGDDGHGRGGGGLVTKRRQRAVVVATNEPTDRTPNGVAGPRFVGLTFTMAADAAEAAACWNVGPTGGLVIGGGASAHTSPLPAPADADVGVGAAILCSLGALVVFVVLALLSNRPRTRGRRV